MEKGAKEWNESSSVINCNSSTHNWRSALKFKTVYINWMKKIKTVYIYWNESSPQMLAAACLLPSGTRTNWSTKHWNTVTKHWQQHIARTHAKGGTTLGCLLVLTSWTTFCWNIGIKGFIRGMSIWIWKDAIAQPQTSGIKMTQFKFEGCSSTTKRYCRQAQT